ncbi:gamma-glutamyl-gamma-aminobutyrate hydrolase family protein [soil metagenome]
MSKVVGIASGRKYENYRKWILQMPEVEVIDLNYADNNGSLIKQCHGLVLTGGEDVHPRFYNKPEYVERYGLDDFDEQRDEFELKLLEDSYHLKLPVLGICRGLQIANVFFGGTLIPDIPSFGKPSHTKYEEGRDRYHSVKILKNTFLESLAGSGGEVNSAHHQGVDVPAGELKVNCLSADGIIEGMEWQEGNGKPYLLLVQWHPERMTHSESRLSKNIRDSFIKSLQVSSVL